MTLLPAEDVDLDLQTGSSSLADRLQSGLYRAVFSASGEIWTGPFRIDRQGARRLWLSGDLYTHTAGDTAGPTVEVFPRNVSRLHLASVAARPNDIDPLVTDFESTVRDGVISVWCQPHIVTISPLGLKVLAEQWQLQLIPLSDGSFAGKLITDDGQELAAGPVRRISEQVRRCTIRIIRHPHSEIPEIVDTSSDLRTAFAGAGWAVRVTVETMRNEHQPRKRWSNAELLSILPDYVDDSAVETDWLALLFCVPELADTTRGVMFDFGNAAHNQVPRQACAIASHWMVPDAILWKSARGQRYGTISSLYFRTALHELLHVFSIGHPANANEVSIRQTTDALMPSITNIPGDVPRAFGTSESRLLRHLPDIVARPGGLTSEHDAAEDQESLRLSRSVRLNITPLCREFPLGVPVRLRMVCRNQGTRGVRIPARIGFAAGVLRVSILAPSGEVHNVGSNVVYDSSPETTILGPHEQSEASITLFAGSRGPIFTESGHYQIVVSIATRSRRIEGHARVTITPIRTKRRAELVRSVLRNDKLQILLVTGKPDRELDQLLKAVLRDRLLGPHFRYLATKPYAQWHWERPPQLSELAKLRVGNAIMTSQELLRAAESLSSTVKGTVRAKKAAWRLLESLRADAQRIPMIKATRAEVLRTLRAASAELCAQTNKH